MRLRALRFAVSTTILGFAGLNVLAYQNARALTRFAEGKRRTPPPPALTAWQKVRVVASGPAVPRPRIRRTPEAVGLPYERHVFAGAHGLPVEAWLIPHPRPRGVVALFHGHADTKSSLLNTARLFYEMGWSPFLVDSDPYVTEMEARSIHDALQGPKALKLFRGLGHESFLRRRQEWLDAVSGFLGPLEREMG